MVSNIHTSKIEKPTYGFAHYKILYDSKGKAVDYQFVNVNDHFEFITGLKSEDIISKNVNQIPHLLNNSKLDLNLVFKEIALTENSISLELYSEFSKRWYKVQTYFPNDGYFSSIFIDITEEKEKNTDLQKLFLLTLDLLCITDLECNFIKVNNEWEKVLGYSKKELETRKFLDFIHPDDLAATLEAVEQLLKSKEIIDFINRYMDINGKYHYIEWRGIVEDNLIYASARDITLRKETEAKLEHSELNFRALFEKGPIAIAYHKVINDEKGNPRNYYFLEANKTYQELTGVNPVGKLVTEAFPGIEKDPFNWIGTFGEVAKTGKEIRFEQYLEPNKRWYDVVGYQYKPDHFVAAFIEITDKKLSEKRTKSELMLRKTLFDFSRDGIVLIDSNHQIFDANPQFCKMLGYSIDEIKELYTWDYETLATEDEIRKNFGDFANLDTTFESIHKRKDGSKYSVEVNIKGIEWNDEEFVFCTCRDITEKKKNENERNEREKFLNTVLQTTLDGFWVFDKYGKILDVNEAYCKMSGYNKEEILNLTISKIDALEDKKDTISRINRIMKNGSELFETVHKKKDSSLFSVEISATYLEESRELFVCFCRDITERKIAEELLRNSEENFRMFAENSSDVIWTMNSSGKFLYVSPSVHALRGFTPEENLQQSYMETLTNESIKIAEKLFKEAGQAISKGVKLEPMTIALEQNCKDGSTVWTEIRISAVYDNNDNFKYFLGVTRDISERKKAEEALRDSETRYRLIAENTSDGIIIFDEKYRIKYVSPSYVKQLGYSEEEELMRDDKNIYELIHPEDRDILFANIFKAIEEKKTELIYSYRAKHKNGHYIWREDNAKFNYDENENLISTYVICRDISERKIAEKALVESQRLEAIGEMSASIAHDFNNSLQSIFGNIELALIHLGKENPSRKYLETIRTSASDAAERIKLLQRFAGNSNSAKGYTSININEIIDDVIIQSKPLWKDNAQKAGIEINVKSELGSEIYANGKASELRSVIFNLIKNSIEAMPKGGLIKLQTINKNKSVLIRITDNGIGMDEKTRLRLFQPFYSTKGFDQGRGLGLSSVFSIIQEHKGKIEVVSTELGKGTTIEITLPKSENEASEQLSDILEISRNTTLKILWVDDDETIREIASEIIEMLGHKGKVLSNGDAALNELENNNYDIVITDIGMPGMSGWDLAKKISEKYSGEIKTVLASGWGEQITEKEKEIHGVSQVISKPFRIAQISKLINDM